jgi:ubiquinone/menaquinone biosynthesis C-methylase UbiE
MMKVLRRFADSRRNDSLATKLRRKRFTLFKFFISSLPQPLSILDVGGTQIFWEQMGFTEEVGVEVVLFNLTKIKVKHPNFRSVVGDARAMKKFRDKEFDVIFSNSVIEHLSEYKEQRKMAKEVQRVGKRYFIQTPNYFFPFEAHFLFPFFQFFPLKLKAFLIRHFNLGWQKKTSDKQKATEIANSVKLLTKKDLQNLFPNAKIYKEKFLGLTKSFIVYDK